MNFDKISGKLTTTSVTMILCVALLCASVYTGQISVKDDKLVIIIAVFEIKEGEVWRTNYENGMEIVYVTGGYNPFNQTIVYAWAIDFGFLTN